MNALIIGGSSGIGLSIVLSLIQHSRYTWVYVVDKSAFPEQYNNSKIIYFQEDLSNPDYSFLEKIEDVYALYITAGFGRLQLFQEVAEEYIQQSFQVNTIAVIRIIKHFYSNLLSKDDFYCAVMVSIAGRLCSPLFSVYSATKAALSKFIEAVNIELEVQNSCNRVLEVSPGVLKGTSFSGEKTIPQFTAKLAEKIIKLSENHERLYIPEYETIFQKVLERYYLDAHQFGVDSYYYKINSNRVKND